MKKVLFFLISLIILFLTYFCEEKKATSVLPLVDIEINVKNVQKIYLSQFTDNIRYVALESNQDNPIAYINYLDLSEKFILVSDRRSCILFSNEGHFIRTIGKQGRGPGEYTWITGVILMNRNIYIRNMYDLIEYKLDGTFLKRYKDCFLANGKYVLLPESLMINDSIILGYIENRTGQMDNKALIVDKQGEVKYYYKSYNIFNLKPGVPIAGGVNITPSIYKFDNKIFSSDPFNDTLFQLNDQYKFIPEYIFNIGKFAEPPSERAQGINEYEFSNFIHVINAFQTEKFLIINCHFGKYFPARRLTPQRILLPSGNVSTRLYNTQIALGIFNKRTGNLVFSEPTSTDNQLFTSGLYNDIDAGPRFLPIKMVNDSTMLMNIELKYLKEHISSDDYKNNNPKYPEKKKRLEELTDSLTKTECDNPVIMFVTFKK